MTFETLPGKTLEQIVPEHLEKWEEEYNSLMTKNFRKEVVMLMVAFYQN